MSDNKYYVNQRGKIVNEITRKVSHSLKKLKEGDTTSPKISPTPEATMKAFSLLRPGDSERQMWNLAKLLDAIGFYSLVEVRGGRGGGAPPSG